MERWSGRVALVTGASMGIGASVARRLVAEGMKVVGAARSIDKLQDEEVLAMFAKIKKDLGGMDVCINNAGFTHNKSLLGLGIYPSALKPTHPPVFLTPLLSCGFTERSPKEWREMMDLNVVALCLCTRESIASMRERGVDDGHIIHINSIAGHRVNPNKAIHFYAATKFAVTALTEGLRQELREANSNIRISAISPGVVETEFVMNARLAKDANAAKKLYKERGSMSADDVTATLVHILGAPPHVQIHDVQLRPVTQVI
ncbi:dehydrogenase/reductase SDR family member 11-like [Eriocheir sinensis]|uniref:dehydrogenase/reductase SDR family member 11-like n=1 Tax=Eriocheir sinensis TaxID=95602 RepID=UPI0021CA55AA|nr:dehydrogenase/reductase SDR family member 11-like [Eriocheir sinensis]